MQNIYRAQSLECRWAWSRARTRKSVQEFSKFNPLLHCGHPTGHSSHVNRKFCWLLWSSQQHHPCLPGSQLPMSWICWRKSTRNRTRWYTM